MEWVYTMRWILLACLMLLLATPAAAQCHDRPYWHWDGYYRRYDPPVYSYHYRSWSYRWRRDDWD
jgi:hypothetical protein